MKLLAIVLTLVPIFAAAGWEARHRYISGEPRAWIRFSEDSEPEFETLAEALAELKRHDQIQHLNGLNLTEIFETPEFQEEILAVMKRIDPDVLSEAEASAGNLHNPKMVALRPVFEQAVLETEIAKKIAAELKPLGFTITEVSYEKLFFSDADDDGARKLNAFVWLVIRPAAVEGEAEK